MNSTLAIFDLDKTLLNGDSDFLWGEFLVEVGAVDHATYQQTNQQFFDDYAVGKLDIYKYLEFCLQPLAIYSKEQLYMWRDAFIEQKIKPLITQKALQTVEKHRNNGDVLLIITATNQFVVENIVKLFGIDNLLATGVEVIDGQYTGKTIGVPCFQEGKITNLNAWLQQHPDISMQQSYFYSDSFNDLPLLERVDNPVVVNADSKLLKVAQQKHWKIENWA
jgi:HAD superfamily hydrolase (TIGR01490 family)